MPKVECIKNEITDLWDILNICILPSGKASPNNTTSGRTTPPHPSSSQWGTPSSDFGWNISLVKNVSSQDFGENTIRCQNRKIEMRNLKSTSTPRPSPPQHRWIYYFSWNLAWLSFVRDWRIMAQNTRNYIERWLSMSPFEKYKFHIKKLFKLYYVSIILLRNVL